MRLHAYQDRSDENDRLAAVRARIFASPAAEVVFEHAGAIDQGTITRFVEMAERSDRLAFDGTLMRKRLVNIGLEALDNVRLYTRPEQQASSYALFASDEQGYVMVFGNIVDPAVGALLVHRLGIINQMDAEDLREHYKKLLGFDGRSREGGAGLGLLTMARRATGPLLGGWNAVPPDMAFFTLEIRLDRGQAAAA